MARIIYLDLDGVLADFKNGVMAATGRSPEEFSADELLARIALLPEFFLKLDVAESGKLLFETAQALGEVRILAEIPRKTNLQFAEQQKRRWVAMHFGTKVPFLAVQYAYQKADHARPGDILIDESARNISRWVEAGGTGIIHTDFDSTAAALMNACAGAPLKRSDETLSPMLRATPRRSREWPFAAAGNRTTEDGGVAPA